MKTKPVAPGTPVTLDTKVDAPSGEKLERIAPARHRVGEPKAREVEVGAGKTLLTKGLFVLPSDLLAVDSLPNETNIQTFLERASRLPEKDRAEAMELLAKEGKGRDSLFALYCAEFRDGSATSRAQTVSAATADALINGATKVPRVKRDASEALDILSAYARDFGFDGVHRDGKEIYVEVGDRRLRLGDLGKGQVKPSDIRKLGRELNARVLGTEVGMPPARVKNAHWAPAAGEASAFVNSALSSLAYQDPELVGIVAKAYGYDTCEHVHDADSDTHAFVLGSAEGSTVVFRGTSSFSNFMTDANFLKTDGPGGRVHRGFKNAHDSVWSRINAELEKADGPVRFTGHSLGAGLAQIAAKTYADSGGTVDAVLTYGSPRVGNKEFAESYRQALGDRTFIHINDADVVTRVPPRLLFGYADLVGIRRQLGGKDFDPTQPFAESVARDLPDATLDEARLAISPHLDEELAAEVGALKDVALEGALIPGVADHAMTQYQAALYEALLQALAG